jgi:hypothetical protein
MSTQASTQVDRRRRAIAAAYRKQGYQVTRPSMTDALPPFLHDCHPDLIAEKDGDHVVIEVKPSGALKGANDLIELADRVAAQPGWRLELVTVRTEPDYSDVLTLAWLERMLRPPTSDSEMDRHCIYLAEVMACLVRGLASINKLRIQDKSTLHLARELVYLGRLNQDIVDRMEDLLEWQDSLMRQMPMSRPTAQQTAELVKLCRDLHAQAHNPKD